MSNTEVNKLETIQLLNEIIECQDALAGMKKADAFIFYTDKAGRGRTLFLDNLRHFPFDIQKELKIMLADAIDLYIQQRKTQLENEQ